MPYGLVVDLARGAVMLATMIAGPLLGVALVVGLLLSVVQAVTQIQEQTVTFVAKLLSVAVVFLLTLTWMLHVAVQYTIELFHSLPTFVS